MEYLLSNQEQERQKIVPKNVWVFHQCSVLGPMILKVMAVMETNVNVFAKLLPQWMGYVIYLKTTNTDCTNTI